MLPRLRFVFAAALIAAFPWILLGSGIITTTQNTPISEHSRAGTGVAVSAGDLRDAQHMHALAFVRRSRELERLRELGSAPLSDWIATPAGLSASDPTPPASSAGGDRDQRIEPSAAVSPPSQSEPAPEPQVVASLPAEPAESAETPAASPSVPEPELADRPVPIAPAATEEAPHATADVEPDLSRVDWSKVVPPLPRARSDEEHRKTGIRRARIKRSHLVRRQVQADPFATPAPNPFGGPPATATTYNPGRNNGISH